MKEIIAAGLMAGMALFGAATAHADTGDYGSQGDRNARAFWEDKGRNSAIAMWPSKLAISPSCGSDPDSPGNRPCHHAPAPVARAAAAARFRG